MHSDPIVDEVLRVREQLAAKFNYDIAAIFADMRSRESLVGDRLKNRQQLAKPEAIAIVGEIDSAVTSPMNATP